MGECDYGCGQEAKYEFDNGKICCSEHYTSCPAVREKNSKGLKEAHENGNVSTEQLDGNRAWNKGQTFDIGEGGKKPIKDTASPKNIKYKLVNKRGHICERCGDSMHMGNKIPLEMHRIDESQTYKESGSDNLKLLCANCHRQTSNWGYDDRNKVDDQELIQALQNSDSIKAALETVELVARGKNYDRAYRLAAKNNIGV